VTPEEEQRVRRLLAASASEPTPLPDDVAARLDTVLADLSVERAAEGVTILAHDPIHDPRHDPRQVRRRWPSVLVAAAAVAVVALGVGTIVRSTGGQGADSQASGSGPAAAKAIAPDAGASPQTPSRSAGSSGAVPRLHTRSLREDVRRLAEQSTGVAGDLAGPASRPQQRTPPSCAIPPATQGERVFGVRLDGKPATLVLHPAVRGARSADVYPCADASVPVATTRFRVP
jgi:hypothetical protein